MKTTKEVKEEAIRSLKEKLNKLIKERKAIHNQIEDLEDLIRKLSEIYDAH